MSRDGAIPTPRFASRRSTASRAETIAPAKVATLGYWGVLLLTFLLPFDLEQRPLLWTHDLTLTNLTVLLLIGAAWALVTMGAVAMGARRGSSQAARYFIRRRLPLALWGPLLATTSISFWLSPRSTQGWTWLLDLLAGAALWLALPVWLEGDTGRKVSRLGAVLVAGAVVAAALGLAEVQVGPSFDTHLLAFKFGPSTMGPFLRLSASFSSANVAAMYFELALPFALAGLWGALRRTGTGWWTILLWAGAADLLLIALVLTYSRGALLGLAAAAVAMAAAARGGLRQGAWVRALWPTSVLAANLILILGIFSLWSAPIERLRLSSQTDRAWYEAAYSAAAPATMPVGGVRTVAVTVQNRSPLNWDGSHPRTYGLGYHWLYPSWRVEQFENPITWLGTDVPPGGRRTVQVRVTAPSVPGRYLLVWDMNRQGTTWFAPRTGGYQTSSVRVLPGVGGTVRLAGPGHRPDIAQLPTAPALDRSRIWAVAVRMIAQRPLFGLGPQGVRMNYDTFSPPGPSETARKPPPHAHDLALELLADWGIVGTAVFAGLLLVLLRPLVQRVVSGQIGSVWELAPIGAAAALLGHETVDYFLTKTSILTVLWLLCGLAWVMGPLRPGAREDRAQLEAAVMDEAGELVPTSQPHPSTRQG